MRKGYEIGKISVLLLVLSLAITPSFGQFGSNNYEYSKEIIWGLNKNSNGGIIGGVVLRMSLAKGKDVYETYGIELSNVKHPKELSYRNANTFIWGKSNYLYSIRTQYGRERVLFKKAPQQGVQISIGAAAGPTIGLVTPYYIQFSEQNRFEPFENPTKHPFSKILGSGRLFQGLDESKINFGINAKTALNFEFGTLKNSVAGLEIGAMVEAFPKEIIIMPTQDNRAVFPSMFFLIYWGGRK